MGEICGHVKLSWKLADKHHKDDSLHRFIAKVRYFLGENPLRKSIELKTKQNT